MKKPPEHLRGREATRESREHFEVSSTETRPDIIASAHEHRTSALQKFEAVARGQTSVWAVYQHWLAAGTKGDRITSALELLHLLEGSWPELGALWCSALEEMGYFAEPPPPASWRR